MGGVSVAGAATLLATPGAQAATTSETAAVTAAQAKASIRAVNAGMRSNYAALKSELIKHLSPVIVVENDARGGKFTLVTSGGQESVNPVPEAFELAKSIAHVPLGCFSVLASYLADEIPAVPNAGRIDAHDVLMVAFRDASSTAWTVPLQAYADTLTTARKNLPAAQLPPELTQSCTNILDGALRFIRSCLATKRFDMQTFESFSGSVYPDIRTNMRFASEAQISGVQNVMNTWRARLGAAAWSDLYTVVVSQWTTSVLNQNTIIIKDCMDPAKVETHLIDLPGLEPPTDPIFTALDNLARIVQDNVAAELVFPRDTKVADALKGSQDLLSDEILNQLGSTSPLSAPTYNLANAAEGTCPVRR
ncbi:hypothetical protein [Flexivirga meconopsidis]|uniref:hypothetical protein n=1 Tax=Flexivirga meconopsidis TaxID=2977121 RepID=UPI00223FECC4|nr:hypothetical protein [Flexivirga meconopsidis]